MKSIPFCRPFMLSLCALALVGCASSAPQATLPPGVTPREDVGPLYDYGSDVAPETRQKIVVLGYQVLKPGMTRDQVLAKMGPPDIAEALYDKQPPHNFRGWAHRYIISDSEIISLYFDPVEHRLQRGMTHGIPGLQPLGLPASAAPAKR